MKKQRQFKIGATVRVLKHQWHAGHTGKVVDLRKGKALVNLPGPQPRTNNREWIAYSNLELVSS